MSEAFYILPFANVSYLNWLPEIIRNPIQMHQKN